MLHELCHNEIGPHNQQFHAMWDQLRKEYEGLLSKGYTGEGFLSDGKRLGGRRVPRHEARRLARIAAEKRQILSSGSGQKLGGRAVPYGTDIRRVIVDAIERRNTVLKGCGESKMNNKEIKDLADQATQNGFNTQAEEDEANEAAIAQAMWELVQEDHKKEYGDLYIPPSAQNPTGNGGGNLDSETMDEPSSRPPPSSRRPSFPNITSTGLTSTRQPPSHVSRLVFESSKQKPKATIKEPSKPSPAQNTTPPAPALTGWTCEICTLYNPIEFLCCDACTTERPDSVSNQIAQDAQRKAAMARQARPQPKLWTCSRCSTKMEDQWWSCSTCGKVKESS
jgi:chorismate mutase